MATAPSVIHIFVENAIFPQFYSKNGQKKRCSGFTAPFSGSSTFKLRLLVANEQTTK